jgi:hypothetical protein
VNNCTYKRAISSAAGGTKVFNKDNVPLPAFAPMSWKLVCESDSVVGEGACGGHMCPECRQTLVAADGNTVDAYPVAPRRLLFQPFKSPFFWVSHSNVRAFKMEVSVRRTFKNKIKITLRADDLCNFYVS